VRNADLRVARAKADLLENAIAIQHLTGRLLARYATASRTGQDRDAGPTASTTRPNVGSF